LRIDATLHPARAVTIAHECHHFSASCGLNRFLVLLLISRLKASGRSPRYSSVRTHDIVPAKGGEHIECDPDHPENCREHPHIAKFVSQGCLGKRPQDAGPDDEVFDFIIVRHGVNKADWYAEDRDGIWGELLDGNNHKFSAPDVSRQILPYWVD
jgi:hypothetical protein